MNFRDIVNRPIIALHMMDGKMKMQKIISIDA
jgi:hypothetical protein